MVSERVPKSAVRAVSRTVTREGNATSLLYSKRYVGTGSKAVPKSAAE